MGHATSRLVAALRPHPEEAWLGRALLDPDGVRIGHVERVERAGYDGSWLDIRSEWGALDWLLALGCGRPPTFRIHSSDVESLWDELYLKEDVRP